MGTMIAAQGGVKKLALLAGCLLFLACSPTADRTPPGPGRTRRRQAGSSGGGQAGTTGGGGHTAQRGTTGSAGTNGGAGTTGSAGTNGGAGTSGSAGTNGGGGQTGGSTGSGGRGGTTGSAGTIGGAGTGGKGGSTGGGGKGGSAGGGGGAKGGQGGAGGQGGKGQGGTGGITNCPEWETLYAKALQTARMCQANLTIVQCATLASSKLACGCPMYVNDGTELEKIRAEWLQSSCALNVICPAIACPLPGKAGCTLMNSGDFCVSQPTPTPAN